MKAVKGLAVSGKYVITTHAPVQGIEEEEDVQHVKAHKGKLKGLAVPHPHTKDGNYGPGVRIAVKNKETGATTHHSVYQSGFDEKSKKPIISVRSYENSKREHNAAHSAVLISHLSGKQVNECLTFKDYFEEAFAAQARAGEREWHSQAAEPQSSKAKMPAVDSSHNEKMFRFHAQRLAAATKAGDEKGKLYHNIKLKHYSTT